MTSQPEQVTGLRITAACSLCGHEYARCFDEATSAAHMAEAHDMHLVPGSPRPGDPPRWELRPPGVPVNDPSGPEAKRHARKLRDQARRARLRA